LSVINLIYAVMFIHMLFHLHMLAVIVLHV